MDQISELERIGQVVGKLMIKFSQNELAIANDFFDPSNKLIN
jgi:hypothetical protein